MLMNQSSGLSHSGPLSLYPNHSRTRDHSNRNSDLPQGLLKLFKVDTLKSTNLALFAQPQDNHSGGS